MGHVAVSLVVQNTARSVVLSGEMSSLMSSTVSLRLLTATSCVATSCVATSCVATSCVATSCVYVSPLVCIRTVREHSPTTVTAIIMRHAGRPDCESRNHPPCMLM